MRIIKNILAILLYVYRQDILCALSQLAVWLGFISHRYFHVCGLLHFWETTQRKWTKCSMKNTDVWEATHKLIWHCIFDNRLRIWKTICLEPLCQQAETERQGAVFLENYLWFILLRETFFFSVKASIGNSAMAIPVKPPVPVSDWLSLRPDIAAGLPGCTLGSLAGFVCNRN